MLRSVPKSQRKSVNISIESRLIQEAKELGINISRAAEESIEKAVSEEKSRRWLLENKEAIENWNEYVLKNGLPLAKYRQF